MLTGESVGQQVRVVVSSDRPVRVGATMHLGPRYDHVVWMDPASGVAIGREEARKLGFEAAGNCEASDFVLLLVMAWSPPARQRRHCLGFNHPEATPPSIPTTRRTAPSTFYGNSHLGYAVGLYGIKELGNLESIRRIRNVFAHAPSIVRFDTPEIVAECNKFTILEHRRDVFEKAVEA